MKNVKHFGKRWLAMVLSLVMCFGLLQTTALAARNYSVPVYAVGVDSNNKVVSVMPQGFTAKGNTTTQESTTTGGVQNGTWNWTANSNNTYTMTAYASTNVNVFPYIKWPGDLWNMPSGTTYKGYKTFSTPPYVGQSLGAPNAPGYSWQYGKSPFTIQVANATGTYLVYYFSVPDPTYNYSLTYNGNGGTVNGQAAYTATSGNVTATSYSFNSLTAERSGFEFLGWASTQAAANNGTVDVSWPVTLTSSNSSKTVYAVWKESAPAHTVQQSGTGALNVIKTFSGASKPDAFAMTYQITNGATVGTVSSGILVFNEIIPGTGIYMATVSYPVWSFTGVWTDTEKALYDSVITMTEVGADVSGMDLAITATAGTVNNAAKTITHTVGAQLSAAGNLTVTNTYTPTEVIPDNPKLTGITKTRLTSVPAELGLTGINTDTPVSLKVGEQAKLLYAITVTGDEGANYTITDPTAIPVDPSAMTGTIGGSGEATVYVTMTIDINDVVEGYVENVAYVEAGAGTDPIPGTDPSNATPSEPVRTQVRGEMISDKTRNDPVNKIVNYTIDATNMTGITKGFLVVTDVMDEGLSIVTDESGQPIYTLQFVSKDGTKYEPVSCVADVDGQTVTWEIDIAFAQGDSFELAYQAEVATPDESKYLNNNYTIEAWNLEPSSATYVSETVSDVEDNWVSVGSGRCSLWVPGVYDQVEE